MEEKEINLKSSTIEKGLELAKDFLGKLIMPAVEELGLLASDNIRYLRYKNQLRLLLKAREYVQKNNIPLKEIPVKILLPLLENSSLEEVEELQDKWTNMLVNMANSEHNFQNQIFPYILSQISIAEYRQLLTLKTEEAGVADTISRYSALKVQLTELDRNADLDEYNQVRQATITLSGVITAIEQKGFQLQLQEFEKANLVWLGLIQQLPPGIRITQAEEVRLVGVFYNKQVNKRSKIHAQYLHDKIGYRMTELGAKFMTVCEIEKKVAT